jgi:hypothetical protein
MLKTISSITNALGALNYKGTWNASTNTPTLTSSVGAKGDYYVVSVAGSTNLNGETLWGVGDWAVFNGSVWQRVEGGDTINATTVTASTSVTTPIVQAINSSGLALKNSGGTTQLSSGAGGGDNITLSVATSFTDNLIQNTAAKGVNFTANTPQAGMTSRLLNWYEEGVSTVTLAFGGASTGITYAMRECRYTRIGNRIFVQIGLAISSKGSSTGAATISGLPFTNKNVGYGGVVMTTFADNMTGINGAIYPFLPENSSTIQLKKVDLAGNFNIDVTNTDVNNTSYFMISGNYLVA